MIRKAVIQDLPAIMEVYRGAQGFMAQTGNPTQWGNFYPTIPMLEEDIALNRLHVIVRDNDICGVFMFAIGEDPWYAVIDNGEWLDNSLYGVIHRIASCIGARGVVREATEFALEKIGHIRIDTHEDNKIMQHVLEKIGYQRRGVIYVYDGTPREAYEYVAK
jgi:hypothetical protein